MGISALASMDGEIIVWAVSHSAASLSESRAQTPVPSVLS